MANTLGLIIQWNCRSAVSKKCELINLINKYNPFALALQETWLKPGFIFKINSFYCLRDDRSSDGYGGVCLLIKNNINFTPINIPQHSQDISIVGATMFNISVVSVYVPHPSTAVLEELNILLTHTYT